MIPARTDMLITPLVECRHHDADPSSPDHAPRLAVGYNVCEHAEALPRERLIALQGVSTRAVLDLASPKGPKQGSLGIIACADCASRLKLSKPTLICAHDALELFGVETPLGG